MNSNYVTLASFQSQSVVIRTKCSFLIRFCKKEKEIELSYLNQSLDFRAIICHLCLIWFWKKKVKSARFISIGLKLSTVMSIKWLRYDAITLINFFIFFRVTDFKSVHFPGPTIQKKNRILINWKCWCQFSTIWTIETNNCNLTLVKPPNLFQYQIRMLVTLNQERNASWGNFC